MDRIVVTDGWPRRIGCRGVIVPKPSGKLRPGDPWVSMTDDEVVVLLDDDPLQTEWALRRGWSCVVKRAWIAEAVEGEVVA